MKQFSRIISCLLICAVAISCGNGARKTSGQRHSFPLEREQNLSNYVWMLISMPDVDEARRDVDKQMAKIEASGDTASYRSVLRLMSHYLYDPNSPMRDEDIYQVVAERASRSKLVDSTMYARYALEAATSPYKYVFALSDGTQLYYYTIENTSPKTIAEKSAIKLPPFDGKGAQTYWKTTL